MAWIDATNATTHTVVRVERYYEVLQSTGLIDSRFDELLDDFARSVQVFKKEARRALLVDRRRISTPYRCPQPVTRAERVWRPIRQPPGRFAFYQGAF